MHNVATATEPISRSCLMGMAKASRLLFILNLVRSRRTLNARRLAEECGVTERSIYRDIIALSEVGIPIYYDKGYKCTTDNWLPPLNFDYDEYMTLRLILDGSPLKRSFRYRELLRQISAKVEATLSDRVREHRKQHTVATVSSVRTTFKPEVIEKVHPVLEAAIDEHLCVDMRYASLSSEPRDRRVEPYFVIFRDHAFYLVAWCTEKKEFRTFRLDRISRLEVTNERFLRRKGIDPQSYFDGRWSLIDGPETEVQIRFRGQSARVVESGQHHPSEVYVREGESLLYRVRVKGTDEIARWILGFGGEAEVIAPAELRVKLQTLGAEIVRRHQIPKIGMVRSTRPARKTA